MTMLTPTSEPELAALIEARTRRWEDLAERA